MSQTSSLRGSSLKLLGRAFPDDVQGPPHQNGDEVEAFYSTGTPASRLSLLKSSARSFSMPCHAHSKALHDSYQEMRA
jgi:hypothetical protein